MAKAILRAFIPAMNGRGFQHIVYKFGIEAFPSSYQRACNEGRSTQVPTGRVIGVKARIKRKIGYAGKYIAFEYLD